MAHAASTGASGRTTTLRLSPYPARANEAGAARRRFLGGRLDTRRELLAPRGVGQILDTACDVFAARFPPCFGIALLLWFPALFGQGVLLRAGAEELMFFWTVVVDFLVQMFAVAFICSIVGGHLQGNTVPALEAFGVGLRRFPGMVVLGAMIGFLTLMGACLCYLPSLVVKWLFVVVPAVYVLEGVGLGEAVSRGVRLVSSGGALLRWMGWSAVTFFMVLPFQLLTEGLQAGPRTALESRVPVSGMAFEVVISMLAAPFPAVATAFAAVVVTVFYVDLRVRREGLDLRLRLEAMKSIATPEETR